MCCGLFVLFCCVLGVGVVPHVGGGAQEGGDAVVGGGHRVGGLGGRVVPVYVPGQMGHVHVHLIHCQQGHLETSGSDTWKHPDKPAVQDLVRRLETS